MISTYKFILYGKNLGGDPYKFTNKQLLREVFCIKNSVRKLTFRHALNKLASFTNYCADYTVENYNLYKQTVDSCLEDKDYNLRLKSLRLRFIELSLKRQEYSRLNLTIIYHTYKMVYLLTYFELTVRSLPIVYYYLIPNQQELLKDSRLYMMIKYYSEDPSKDNKEGIKEIEEALGEEIPTRTELIVPEKILFPWKYEKDDYKYAFIEPRECNTEKFRFLCYNILSKLDWEKIDFKIRPYTFVSVRKTINDENKIQALKKLGYNNLYDFLNSKVLTEHFNAEENLCYVSPGNMRCTLKISVRALYMYSLIEGLIISIKDQIENFDLGKRIGKIKLKNIKLMLDIK